MLCKKETMTDSDCVGRALLDVSIVLRCKEVQSYCVPGLTAAAYFYTLLTGTHCSAESRPDRMPNGQGRLRK